jgi:hypothetical protein
MLGAGIKVPPVRRPTVNALDRGSGRDQQRSVVVDALAKSFDHHAAILDANLSA